MKYRRFRDDIDLSVVGFGGMVVVGMEQADVNSLVDRVIDAGVNYFDIAPQYGDGEAEVKLGEALKSHREKIFLACKTLRRDATGAEQELIRSLERLHTDYFDLYQFHSVSTMEDVEEIFAPGGAIESFVKARDDGLVKYLGFSSHLEEAALDMLNRFKFDSMLFPTNFVCWYEGKFGPAVLKKARELGVRLLGLKSLALRPWEEEEDQVYPNCWYRPIDSEDLARKAMSFTLLQHVTALVAPGDARLADLAISIASENNFPVVISEEELAGIAADYPPIFSNIDESKQG